MIYVSIDLELDLTRLRFRYDGDFRNDGWIEAAASKLEKRSKFEILYVRDRLLGEVFYSKELDGSVTPVEAGFQAVKEHAENGLRK